MDGGGVCTPGITKKGSNRNALSFAPDLYKSSNVSSKFLKKNTILTFCYVELWFKCLFWVITIQIADSDSGP